MNEIINFAIENGYVGAKKLDYTWHGYTLYEPLIVENDGDEITNSVYVGPPLTILVKGNEIRMSTVDEAYEIVRYYIKHSKEE